MLRAVENDTSGKGYCGPTVVASITGMPLSKVLDAFRDVRYGVGWQRRFRRKPRIAGTSTSEVQQVLRALGWVTTLIDSLPEDDPPTLARWLRERLPEWRRAIFILCVKSRPGHWVAVSGRKLCDTHTRGIPVNLSDAPHRRARVHKAFRVEQRVNALPAHVIRQRAVLGERWWGQ